MKAMSISGFGGPEVFERTDLPKPELRPGHVLVRVAATSLNPIDYKIRSGALAALAPDSGVLGFDLAGTVEALGDNVEGFAVGDEVFGCPGAVTTHSGALAEYQLADARLLAKQPTTLPLADCAALPLVAITAWDALVRGAEVKVGERVLIHAATGGVGHLAIQLARIAGAKVFATVSSEAKAQIARELGATPINYRDHSVEEYVAEHTGGDGFDVVFDTVGGDNLMRSFEAASLEGRVASVNTRTTCDLGILHQKALSLHVVFMLIPILHDHPAGRTRHGEILRSIATNVDAGQLRPLIDRRRFPFEQVANAHALLESGEALGKIVLTGFGTSPSETTPG